MEPVAEAAADPQIRVTLVRRVVLVVAQVGRSATAAVVGVTKRLFEVIVIRVGAFRGLCPRSSRPLASSPSSSVGTALHEWKALSVATIAQRRANQTMHALSGFVGFRLAAGSDAGADTEPVLGFIWCRHATDTEPARAFQIAKATQPRARSRGGALTSPP